MHMILEWLSANHGIITSFATVVIALFAVVTAWLTSSLVNENRRLRRIGEEPKIVAYLQGDPRNASVINLEIMNAGRGPARKITFEHDIDEKFWVGNKAMLRNDPDRTPFDFLPQDDKISMFFASSPYVLKKGEELPSFLVRVTWENMKGDKFSEKYILNVRQFKGIAVLASSAERDIADSLKKISKILDGFLRVRNN